MTTLLNRIHAAGRLTDFEQRFNNEHSSKLKRLGLRLSPVGKFELALVRGENEIAGMGVDDEGRIQLGSTKLPASTNELTESEYGEMASYFLRFFDQETNDA